jgi:hypothetical protein
MEYHVGKTYKVLFNLHPELKNGDIFTVKSLNEYGHARYGSCKSFMVNKDYLETGRVIPYMQPGDFIRKENIESEEQFLKIYKLAAQMGCLSSSNLGKWDNRNKWQVLMVGPLNNSLVWGAVEKSNSTEWTPEELLGEREDTMKIETRIEYAESLLGEAERILDQSYVEAKIEELEKELADLKSQKNLKVDEQACNKTYFYLDKSFSWFDMEYLGARPQNFETWGELAAFLMMLENDTQKAIKYAKKEK